MTRHHYAHEALRAHDLTCPNLSISDQSAAAALRAAGLSPEEPYSARWSGTQVLVQRRSPGLSGRPAHVRWAEETVDLSGPALRPLRGWITEQSGTSGILADHHRRVMLAADAQTFGALALLLSRAQPFESGELRAYAHEYLQLHPDHRRPGGWLLTRTDRYEWIDGDGRPPLIDSDIELRSEAERSELARACLDLALVVARATDAASPSDPLPQDLASALWSWA